MNTLKVNLIIVGIAIFSIAGFSQGKIISKYFDKYVDDESFTKVTVSSKMFSLFSEIEGDTKEEDAFLETVSKLEGIKILSSDSIAGIEKMYQNICSEMDKEGYEELMTVRDGDEDVKFSILEKKGKISELLMVVGGKNNFVLLSLYGEIDLKNVSKIAKTMKINGLENLNKIEDEQNQ